MLVTGGSGPHYLIVYELDISCVYTQFDDWIVKQMHSFLNQDYYHHNWYYIYKFLHRDVSLIRRLIFCTHKFHVTKYTRIKKEFERL